MSSQPENDRIIARDDGFHPVDAEADVTLPPTPRRTSWWIICTAR